jgi:hypothetical protein
MLMVRRINHMIQSCGIGALETPTIIFEDNSACITQMESDYIKSNMTKHIIPLGFKEFCLVYRYILVFPTEFSKFSRL